MLTSRPWFVAKQSFGWGWQPATWQGWAVTVAYIVIVGVVGNTTGKETTLIAVLALTVALLGAIALTGTPPGGRL